jgi:hypothetical protein
MLKSSHELLNEVRERLLRAGVAPRHVRRYVNELADHLADLKVEEERAGQSTADAESAALMRLGSMDDLARAMTERKEFQSWCVRAPWAMFGLVPILLLAAAWCIALLILWSGWQIFLANTDTPFVPIDGFASFYFGVGRLLYFIAPILVGWGIGLIAARQRLKAVWPILGFLLIALVGGAARVQASRTTVSGGLGHIRMDFSLGPAVQGSLFHALVIFSLAVLPYLIWRFQKARFFST